jgi:hypothetical protein
MTAARVLITGSVVTAGDARLLTRLQFDVGSFPDTDPLTAKPRTAPPGVLWHILGA